MPVADRDKAIAADTVRIVAERRHPGGVTQIVETRQGLIMAAAGIDNPMCPMAWPCGYRRIRIFRPEPCVPACASAWVTLGVTSPIRWAALAGRADRCRHWRGGIVVTDDLRGGVDANGRPLQVTITVLADELAGAADLVKGKASGIPVAVVRGLGRLVTDLDAPGAARWCAR